MKRVRLSGIPASWAMSIGGLMGFVPGLFAGSLLGVLLSWSAGAILDWQRQLAFTLGVTQQLLPFGDQRPVLEQVAGNWLLVIPIAGLVAGLISALIGALGLGLLTGFLNRSRVGIPLDIEA
jgi:hypothetical protein